MALDFHFINVGKGSCILVDFPSGHLSIIDIDDSRSISPLEPRKTRGRFICLI